MPTKQAFAKSASRAASIDVPKISKIADLDDFKHKEFMVTLGGEVRHSESKFFYKQPHAKLGQFLFDGRKLQNCIEIEVKLMESGDHEIPEKNEEADRKIQLTRNKMMNQLAVANENRGVIILKYVKRLGKYAGMAGEL